MRDSPCRVGVPGATFSFRGALRALAVRTVNALPKAARREGAWRRWAIALVALLSVLALWLGSAATAAAQPLPNDIGSWTAGASVSLPPPPDGYRSERIGDVTWVYPGQASGPARELQDAFDDAWASVVADLGSDVETEMTIRIGRNPEEMRALAPIGHPPPRYAAGVAYPAFGVVLLTLTAPETWQRPDMDAVLTHELSHVALRRAVGGAELPRWFVEGVAVYQAGEYGMERTRTLWQATVQGRVVPLERLSDRFPARPHQVNVAYAQSADLVAYLRRDDGGARRFREVLANVRSGMSFEQAVRSAYGVSLVVIEDRWREDLHSRFRTMPLLVSGGTFWALASVLIVLAYVRRKKRNKKVLTKWAEDEAAVDRLEATVDRKIAAEEEDEGRIVFIVSGEPPGGREPDVPTVEHEGRSHTLH